VVGFGRVTGAGRVCGSDLLSDCPRTGQHQRGLEREDERREALLERVPETHEKTHREKRQPLRTCTSGASRREAER